MTTGESGKWRENDKKWNMRLEKKMEGRKRGNHTRKYKRERTAEKWKRGKQRRRKMSFEYRWKTGMKLPPENVTERREARKVKLKWNFNKNETKNDARVTFRKTKHMQLKRNNLKIQTTAKKVTMIENKRNVDIRRGAGQRTAGRIANDNLQNKWERKLEYEINEKEEE